MFPINSLSRRDDSRELASEVATRLIPERRRDNIKFTAIRPWRSGTRFVTAADVDGDGDLDVLFASFNRIAWFEQRLMGDANDDGIFNSSDLVRVFQAGEYEDRIVGNSAFEEGDWNGDGEFDSADLVLAFQAGHYEKGAASRMSDLAGAVDWLFSRHEMSRGGRAFAG